MKCPLCSGEFERLTTHIVRTHGMTKSEFLKEYPGTQMVSDRLHKQLSEQLSQRNRDNWENPEYRKLMTEQWNSTMQRYQNSPEGIEFLRENGRASMTKLWNSEEFKSKMRDVSSKTMTKTLTKLWSTNRDEMYQMVVANNSSNGFRLIEHDGQVFNSLWEIEFYEKCKERGVEVERNQRQYGFTYRLGDSTHTFYPDFYLPSLDVFVEIKGDHLLDDICKIKLDSLLSRNLVIYLVTSKELWTEDLISKIVNKTYVNRSDF